MWKAWTRLCEWNVKHYDEHFGPPPSRRLCVVARKFLRDGAIHPTRGRARHGKPTRSVQEDPPQAVKA